MSRIDDLIGRASLALPPLVAMEVARMLNSGEMSPDAAEKMLVDWQGQHNKEE